MESVEKKDEITRLNHLGNEAIVAQRFPAIVEERLEWYVYALIDPRDGRLFYIGKGKGSRVFAHATDAIEGDTETEKLDLIRDVIKSGSKVETLYKKEQWPC